MIVLPSAKQYLTYNPLAEIAEFGTKRSTGTFGALNTFGVSSHTLYFKVNWWDGTSNSYSHGVGGAAYPSKLISAPYNTTAEKRFSIIPTDSSGRQIGQIKNITFLNNTLAPVSYIKIDGLSKIDSFICDAGTDLTSYKHNGRVITFALSNTGLGSISFPAGSLTSTVSLGGNASLSAINGLDNLKNRLQIFKVTYSTLLTSLDLSNYTKLFHIDVRGSGLTSLRAQNCTLNSVSYSTYSSFNGGAVLSTTNLGRTAIVQFFNDLANGNGYINVLDSLGATSLTPTDLSIATGKGYTVFGA